MATATLTQQPVAATITGLNLTTEDISPNAQIKRSQLVQETLVSFPIPLTAFRVWDAINTNLPGAGAADDLGIVGGTFGSASPSLQTQDLKAAGASNNRARVLVPLPGEYDAGETVVIRVHAGMLTTISDGTATIDVEAYESDKEAGIGSDLVTTAATTINSVTLADIDFSLTTTGLVRGDWLDIRITTAINDTATGTAVIGIVGSVELLCDVRG